MSGRHIGSQATMIITNVVFGLCVGGTVLIGQYLGAGNRQAIREVIGTLFTGLFILAGIITTVMLILTDPVLYLIKTPAESFAYAKSYFTITMLGTVFIFGYNALAAIMRGLGDSKNPLYFVAIACFTNIVLDLLLVAVIPLGAAGAAVATVISQALSMVLCVVYLRKKGFIFNFNRSSFRPHKDRIKQIIKIGLPSAIQKRYGGHFVYGFDGVCKLHRICGVGGARRGGQIQQLCNFARNCHELLGFRDGVPQYRRRRIRACQKTMVIGMLFCRCGHLSGVYAYPAFPGSDNQGVQ